MSFPARPDSIQRESTASAADLALRRMAHDLRQPLSAIESTAYYLEMVLQTDEPNVREQFRRLHRMVHRADWLVSDAVLLRDEDETDTSPVCVKTLLEQLGFELAMEDPCTFELRAADDIPRLRLASCAAKAAFRHIHRFFRDVAACKEQPVVRLCAHDGEVQVEWHATLEEAEPAEFARLLNPSRGGGLRRFAEAQAAAFETYTQERELHARFVFSTGGRPGFH